MRLLHAGLFCLCVQTAGAQSFGPPLGSLELSFDGASTLRRLDVEPMTDFYWYFRVAIDFGSPGANAIDGLLLWESSLQIPPQITVLAVQWLAPYSFCDGCSQSDWRALLASCVFADDTPQAILRYRARLLQDVDDLSIGLGPASPSNFGATAPGWRVCANTGIDAQDLHPFASGWTQLLILNSTVSDEAQSWSSIKARY